MGVRVSHSVDGELWRNSCSTVPLPRDQCASPVKPGEKKRHTTMKLYYSRLDGGNFGDDLNVWLWERLFPGLFDTDNRVLFVGIGTILDSTLDNGKTKVVFGSGVGYGRPPHIDERWRFYFVRGPLTAKTLSIDPDLAITDAAYCVRLLAAPGVAKRYRASFMCHHASHPDVNWKGLCERAGLNFISPLAPIGEVIDAIVQSEVVIAEAMHGAIIADAFRVPWIPVRYGYRSLDFKWQDWCQSLGLSYQPVDLPSILQSSLPSGELIARISKRTLATMGLGKRKWRRTPILMSNERQLDEAARLLGRLSTQHERTLSADARFQVAMERLSGKVSEVRRDWLGG